MGEVGWYFFVTYDPTNKLKQIYSWKRKELLAQLVCALAALIFIAFTMLLNRVQPCPYQEIRIITMVWFSNW